MNKKAKIAVCLSLAALMFISVFGMVGVSANNQTRAPITENENSETKPPKQQPQEPGVNAEQAEEKKPSLLDRVLGRDKAEQTPVKPGQPKQEQDTVATVSQTDGYYDGDGVIARASVNRDNGATNRVKRDGVYNRDNMDRAYRADNRATRGRVVDGSVGDRPGIIGDEGRNMRKNGERTIENSVDRIGRGVKREVNRADRAVDRAFDRDNNNVTRSTTRNNAAERTTSTMWAVIIGLVIAAAVITLLAVLIPRRRSNSNNRHY